MNTDRQFDIILFDLEGTLVDFQWQLETAAGEILETLADADIDPVHYGNRPSYADLYNKTRDLTASWETRDATRLFDRLSVIYDTYDRDALSRWKPYEDTRFVLSWLEKSNYRMGVVSNCGSHAVGTVLERHKLAHYFDLIVSRNETHYLKPDPEGLKLALTRLKARPDHALFVGDSLNDILAAGQVPMPSCFLAGGESRVTLENAGTATFHISSLSMLPGILTQS